MAKITGTINRLRFFNEENGYSILMVEDDRHEMHTIVCNMASPSVGTKYTFEGDWITHSKFGKQLSATTITPMMPSSIDGILTYLANGPIKGVGPAIAGRIVDKFGEDSFNVIENTPSKLLTIEGIEKGKLKDIVDSWNEHKQSHEIIAFLRGHNVGPNRAVAIYNKYKEKTIEVVEEDPYRLAFEIDGIGFEIADDIAESFDIKTDNPTRVKAGIHHVLEQASGNGHCGLAKADVVRQSAKLLGVDRNAVSDSLDSLKKEQIIVLEEMGDKQLVYLAALRFAEERTAVCLAKLSGESVLESDVETALNNSDISLSPSQKIAQEIVLSNKVSGITGGPGVGKTTILKAVLDAIVIKNRILKIALAAPTGRASQRMSESTGLKAETIHRLLKFNGQEFQMNRDNPLDIDLLVVDEFSMVDIVLMSRLLDAVPEECTVIMVGDKDQLPSVGPGSVLRDVIQSTAVPMATLTEIHRQSADSGIIVNSHAINNGQVPEHDDDFQMHKRSDLEVSKKKLLSLLTKEIPAQTGIPSRDIQVLTPSHKGEMGTVKLNTAIQAALNPNPAKEVVRFNVRYGIGDKVMQTKNDYELGVFNGDVGWITDVDFLNKEVFIKFDRGLVKVDFNQMNNVSLAWAVTIHKSQGSEYPAVIIPIVSEHYIQHARNLFYTGATRGKKLVAIVGDGKSIQRSVTNNPQPNRVSGLTERLYDRFDITPPAPEEIEKDTDEQQRMNVQSATAIGRVLKL